MTVSENRERNRRAEGRETCTRCERPVRGCYCAHVVEIPTRTRLVLLQHPREREVAIGTARMATLCLPRSELHVGLDWSASAPLARALSDPERPPILLYPGEGAVDIVAAPPPGPVTLVVVDGTWSQTKKVVRQNPVLSALPRYAFVPPRPSEYRIRREPNEASVATIEALVHALAALEGRSFEAMLASFRAMIDFQIACQAELHGARVRHARHRARERRHRIPRALGERDVVCVAAEASSWPYTARILDPAYADELVLWAAHRPSTGETLAVVVAPERPIAPTTSRHTGIAEALLRAGGPREALFAAWRAFVRDDDVVCSWGRYETQLFARAGGVLPAARVDLRQIARDVAHGTVGALSEYAATLPAAPGSVGVVGRAGRKLDALRAVVTHLRAMG